MILALSAILVGLVGWPTVGQAQDEIQGCNQAIRYYDSDRDGRYDTVEIACHFSPGGQDQVMVFDVEQQLDPDQPWQGQVNVEDDTWLFDHGSDGRVNLIASFRRGEAGELFAELYDDRNGDGQVSYEVRKGLVEVTESPSWTVQVSAAAGWWMDGNRLNMNLTILTDGSVQAMFESGFRYRLITDGRVDYEIQVYDQDNDGLPSADIRIDQIPWTTYVIMNGTQATVNWRDDEQQLRGGFEYWPYLDLFNIQETGDRMVKSHYNYSPPPIKFDPTSGRIEAIGEFVASRSGEHNCWYYSTVTWTEGEVREADAESPVCFYDLAQDEDGIPEMQVRMWRYLPNEWIFMKGTVGWPQEWIRYSWDQENTQSWSYGLGLYGSHTIDTEIEIQGYGVQTIPYEAFPGWVFDRSWDAAVFVQSTGSQYWTSEGVYAADVSGVLDSDINRYLVGRNDQPPGREYNAEPWMRIEGSLDLYRIPTLYMSYVDAQLHLLGVQSGHWNMGRGRELRYANLDGDAYVDEWQYSENGTLLRMLNISQEFLIYQDVISKTIELKQAQITHSLFETLPPRNHEEWLTLGQLLETQSTNIVPGIFTDLLGQLDGPALRISGAALTNYRPTTNGYRFGLELLPGFTVNGTDWLGVHDQAPGQYVVSYDGTFHLVPMTPPMLNVRFNVNTSTTDLPTQYISYAQKVILENSGQEDAQQVLVMLGASQVGGDITWLSPQTVTILAGEAKILSFPWIPDAVGEWELQVWANLLEPAAVGGQAVSSERTISVQPAQSTNLTEEISAFGVVAPWQVGLLLASILATAGLMGWVMIRVLGKEAHSQSIDQDQVEEVGH